MSCIHRLNSYGLLADSVRKQQKDDGDSIVKTTTNQMILATSLSMESPVLTREHLWAGNDPLCKHRKGFFDHLKPRAFIMSTLRVMIQQGTLIMANFMSDQLEGEMKRNQSVQEGKISQPEADEQAQEWEKEEWEKRWKLFPSRLFTAFAKYHTITILMRSYEKLASLRYDNVVLDKLTMDPFFAAKKLMSTSSQVAENKAAENTVIVKEMFYTTFWGNLIAFMADYSVHQVILCYGYYVYVRRKRQQQQQAALSPSSSEEKVVVLDAAILTSLLRKSTQLFVSRTFGLICSAAGGAIGTLWWPGWGTVLLSNMGEGAASVVMDDGLAISSKNNKQNEGD